MKTKFNFKITGLIAFLLVGLFMLATSGAFAQNANFSGTWAYNESKSKLPDTGGMGGFRMGATKITVTQDNAVLNTERVSQGRDGAERITKEKFTLDGKVSENPAFGDRMRKSVATWSADGKALTISSTMTFDMGGESREIKSSETWKISDDKKTLTIESISQGREGEERKTTLVYDAK